MSRMMNSENLRATAGRLRAVKAALDDRYAGVNAALSLADRDAGHVKALSQAAEGAGAWALVFEDRASFADSHDPFAAYPVSLMQHLAPSLPTDPATALQVIRDHFDQLDQAAGLGGDDDRVGMEDLEAAANAANGFPVEVQQAAQYLLDNTGLFNALEIAADGRSLHYDDEFSIEDIDALIEQNGHLQVLMENFDAIDIAHEGGGADGEISLDDLEAAANPDNGFDPAMQEAAQYLLDNRQILDAFEGDRYSTSLHRDNVANAVLHRLQLNAEEAWDLIWPPGGLSGESTAELVDMLEGDDVSDVFRDQLWVHIAETEDAATLENLVRNGESDVLSIAIAENAPSTRLREVVTSLGAESDDIQAHRSFVTAAIDNMSDYSLTLFVEDLEEDDQLEPFLEALVIDHEEEDGPSWWEYFGASPHHVTISHEYDTVYLERVLDRIGQVSDAATKGIVFEATMAAVEDELKNASNGWDINALGNVTTTYSFTDGHHASLEQALLDLVMTDPEGVVTHLQQQDDRAEALTVFIRELLRSNDQDGGGAIEVDEEGALKVNQLITALAGGNGDLAARLDYFNYRVVAPDSLGNTQEDFPHAEQLGYAGGAISQAIDELELGDKPEGMEAVKLILGVVGLVDPTDTTSVVGTGVDAVTLIATEWAEADIERAQGDWAELEEGLYWALIPTGADHDTFGFPDAFDDFLVAYGNVFDRASIGN